MAKSFYIVDGHWQIFRAYYAPLQARRGAGRPAALTSPAGEPTKATYLFSIMLLKLIAQRRPDYLAVALDSGREHLHRTRLYPQYKANRPQPPEDLAPQIRRIVQIVQAMGVPLLQQVGVEADDIMATLARRLAGENVRIVLVSRDKDLEQLIGPHVVLYDPTRDEQTDAAALTQRKGYPPEKAVEIQTLCGDPGDNVPGIPGVGPKTAVKLIKDYGSAEAVLQHADKLTPKLAENLRKHADNIALARKLVTLADDVDLPVELGDLAFDGVRAEAVRPIFAELGFKRLLEQLDAVAGVGGAPAAAGAGRTTANDFDYRCADTPAGLKKLLAELKGAARLAVDTETTSVLPMWAELVGISLAWQAGKAFYIPLAAPLGQKTLELQTVRKALGAILTDPKVEKIGHNLKYDSIVLASAGMPLGGKMFDTMLAAYVLNADRGSFKLDNLAAEMLDHDCIPIQHLIGKGKQQRRMDEVPTEQVAPYAAEDADVALRLAEKLREELTEEGLNDLFENIEMSLLAVLVDMETAGIRVDPDQLNRQKAALAAQAEQLRARILAAAGCEFNVDSPKQLAGVLFDKLGLPVIKRLKTGPSTDSAVLTELAPRHEVPALVLDYRQITKLLNTYLAALGQRIHPRTLRVHTSFHQAGTATGRLSSSDPNLQNIPIRTELGRQIRTAFVAEPGNVLLSADYSQVELRILAHLSGDEKLTAAFHADQDIHRAVAAEVFAVAPDEVSPDQRARAKTVNFGIIYGQTAFGLAATLRIGRREAQEFIDSYKQRFPKIEEFLRACVARAKAAGYVETLSGRRRRIEGFDSRNPQRRALAERLAINSVVQGSAADLIKIAMIRIHCRLAAEDRPTKMLLQIHDELLFEMPQDAAEADGAIIRQEMIGAMKLAVPLKVDLGVGPNWRDAK